MVQGKITEADELSIHLDAIPSGLSELPTSSSHFYTAAMLPIYPALGQAPNNAGLHTQWLGLLQA